MTDTTPDETSRRSLSTEQKQALAAALNNTLNDDRFDTDTEWEQTHITITINNFALPKPSLEDTPNYTLQLEGQIEDVVAEALEDTPILAQQAATVSAELWNATDEQYE